MAQVARYGQLPCAHRAPYSPQPAEPQRPRCPGTARRPEGLFPPPGAPGTACVTFPALGGPLSSPDGGTPSAQMLERRPEWATCSAW